VIVERIFIRPPQASSQTEHEKVNVIAGSGIVGDRYFGCQDEPGQNITFVEAEEIESFASEYGRQVDLSATSRNVVTRGVRLNELVGREFLVGSLRFKGVELCEPCLGLGQALATADLPPHSVVKRLLHKGGLRAVALSSGELAIGATFANAA
jgi:MOSC domain-containing protein YiiM